MKEPGELFIGGVTYPLVMTICKVCGYTMLFNTIVLFRDTETEAKANIDKGVSSGQG